MSTNPIIETRNPETDPWTKKHNHCEWSRDRAYFPIEALDKFFTVADISEDCRAAGYALCAHALRCIDDIFEAIERDICGGRLIQLLTGLGGGVAEKVIAARIAGEVRHVVNSK